MTDTEIKLLSKEVEDILLRNQQWEVSKGKSGERAILDGHNLSEMNFSGMSMRGASLDRVIFDKSNCSFISFRGAKLRQSSFFKSVLTCSNFEGANLNGVSFVSADMGGAILVHAKINWADLSSCKLRKAKLGASNIRNSNLRHVNLEQANLEETKLGGSNLFNAKLAGANLRYSDLSQTNLSKADLSSSDITGVTLAQARTEGWRIKNIKCDYVYFDLDKNERVPRNRNFKEHEFEELYSWFPSFVYYFKDKMHALDPYLISVIVSALNHNIDELHLQIDEIKGRGLYPQIKFSAMGEYEISEIEGIISAVLDSQLKEIHQSIKNVENSINPHIGTIVDKAIEGITMTKLEFNAPVQTVITDNKGTINIQSISKQEINALLDSLSQLNPENKLAEVAKNSAVKELSKLLAGDVKDLTLDSINWIKSISTELPSDISASIQQWLGM